MYCQGSNGPKVIIVRIGAKPFSETMLSKVIFTPAKDKSKVPFEESPLGDTNWKLDTVFEEDRSFYEESLS